MQPALFQISFSSLIYLPLIVGVINESGYLEGFEVETFDRGKSKYFGTSSPKYL